MRTKRKIKLLSLYGVLSIVCVFNNLSFACTAESAESLKKIASAVFGDIKTKKIINCWGDNPDASWANYGSSGHGGIDISSLNKENPNFYSISEGKVIYAGGDTWNTIAIYDAEAGKDGVTSIYLHASSIDVKINDTVSIGDMLGQEGSKGTSIEHVHFEVRPGKTKYSVLGKELCGSPAKKSTSCTKNPEEYALNYLAEQPVEAELSPDLEIIAKNEKIVIEESIDSIDNYLSFYSEGLLKGSYIYPSGYTIRYSYPLISQTVQRKGDFYKTLVKDLNNSSGFLSLIIAANYDDQLFQYPSYHEYVKSYVKIRSIVLHIKRFINLNSSNNHISVGQLARAAEKMGFEEIKILGKQGVSGISATKFDYTRDNIYAAKIEIKNQLKQGKFVIALAIPYSSLSPNSEYNHAIIINSINNSSIRYTDPWDGGHKRKNINEFFDSIYFGSTQDFLAIRKKDIVRRILPAILHNN